MKSQVKFYSTGEFLIRWEPKKCIHAKECVRRLPKVYNPEERPWIKPDNTSVEELMSQIDACPSGALSYRDFTAGDSFEGGVVEGVVMDNGPIIINGDLELHKTDGSQQYISGKTALCRCGASKNKPFCDGSHVKSGFIG